MAIQLTGLQLRRGDGPQLLLQFDDSNMASVEVDAAGNLTFDAAVSEISVRSNNFRVQAGDVDSALLSLISKGIATESVIDSVGLFDLSLQRNGTQFLRGVDDGFTVGITGTLKLEPGPNADRIHFQGATTSPAVVMVPAPGGGAPNFRIYNNSDINNAEAFIISTTTAGFAQFAVATNGVAPIPITAYNFTSLPVQFIDGNALLPSITFSSGNTTGLFKSGNGIGFTTAGVQALLIGTVSINPSLQIRTIDGTVALPAYSFLTSESSGMFSPSGGNVSFAAGGVLRLELSSSGTGTFTNTSTNAVLNIKANFVSSAPALGFYDDVGQIFKITADGVLNNRTLMEHFGGGGSIFFQIAGSNILQLFPGGIASFVAHQFLPGTNGAPGITFTGDLATGFTLPSGGALDIVVSGGRRMAVRTTFIQSDVPFYVADGTLAAPGFAFIGDTNTGMYLNAPGDISFATDGALKFRVQLDYIYPYVPLRAVSDGTAAAPFYTFHNSPSSGFFLSAGRLGFAWAGVETFGVSGTQVTVFVAGSSTSCALRIGAGQSGFSTSGTTILTMLLNGVQTYVWEPTIFRPNIDAGASIGSDATRFSTGYFDNLVVTNPPWPTGGSGPSFVIQVTGEFVGSVAPLQTLRLDIPAAGVLTTDVGFMSLAGITDNAFLQLTQVKVLAGSVSIWIFNTSDSIQVAIPVPYTVNVMVLRAP